MESRRESADVPRPTLTVGQGALKAKPRGFIVQVDVPHITGRFNRTISHDLKLEMDLAVPPHRPAPPSLRSCSLIRLLRYLCVFRGILFKRASCAVPPGFRGVGAHTPCAHPRFKQGLAARIVLHHSAAAVLPLCFSGHRHDQAQPADEQNELHAVNDIPVQRLPQGSFSNVRFESCDF